MNYAIDLHIHSCLSPCGDDSMTPRNIVNMAKIKGLDIIAITDHNSGENALATMKYGESKGVLVVPGMEVETCEEVHILCLMPDIESLNELQTIVYKNLPDISNVPEIFGRQLIMDDNDNIIGENEKMLITACKISVDELFILIEDLGGCAIPAHVNRESYNLITTLGGVPYSYTGRYLELASCTNIEERIYKTEGNFSRYLTNLFNGGYSFIRSSDAHYLEHILERESFIDLNELSINALINKLKYGV